ncbi:DUF6252 family protein [Flavobacterium sp. DG2-3]|uniref:DUF6252 family protein n=1 Tax=Flavobacterium sp. DG2-3 TaxID=3068317 RepID=UPI00273E470E|nr:DUF6252 family protein [Flavobacterium sp. DG2-3]MDP5198253.1 DUF6252 family protein [Flavobacterium sp. DG2-3]
MKNLKRILFFAIAIFALALSSSCSSNDSEENTPQSDFVKFKYEGKNYSFEPDILISSSMNIMVSEGIDDNYKKLSLWLPLNAEVGSHPVVYDLSNLTTTYRINFSFMPELNNVDIKSGTINITVNNDKKIEGTFNFSHTKNEKNYEVTDGSFSISKF